MAILLGVKEHMWAKLARAASSMNVDHKAGSTASLAKGGSIEILGFTGEFGDLCRYRAPPGEVPAGAMCPDGALVFLPHETTGGLPSLENVRASIASEMVRRDEAVSRILGE